MTASINNAPDLSVEGSAPPGTAGPLGRLGAWTAGHFKHVLIGWLVLVAALGAFAPQVTSVLSGAGWQSNGSESVQVRELAEKHFGGNAAHAIQVVISSESHQVSDPAVERVIAQVTTKLKADDRISEVVAPQAGATISRDSTTAIVLGGAGASTDDMVRAAEDLKDPLRELSTGDVTVRATGSSVMWSDFNTANLEAMIQAEILSWPVTLAVLVVAFGSLVAAGLPLLLTMAGLVASIGSLVLISHVTPLSIWAMDFALMFAFALGIDYALFLVIRYRAALKSLDRRQAVEETMDTAGKAVMLSGLTVLVSLSALMLVPAPAVRTMAVGIMLSVVFVLAATLTLLPATLGQLGPKVNKWALPRSRVDRTESQRFGAWGERLWRQPLRFGALALTVLVTLAIPVFGLKTAMPSIKVVPEEDSSRQGYALVQEHFGEGAPGMLHIMVPDGQAGATAEVLNSTKGIAGVMPAQSAADESGWSLIQAIPSVDPSDSSLTDTVSTLRADAPDDALVGGAAVENIDLKQALDDKAPLVIGVILILSFMLLLIALQAPLVAALGVMTNLLATAAAFGVARLIFQEGHLANLLGFEPQGFLDGWGPVFFFAMIFAIAMDYTVFLLSSAKEHYERTGNPRQAAVGSLAHTGRVVFAAAAVMVAVFFTFALAEPLPPKEMGIVLGIAVLLDSFLIRLVLLPVLLRLTGRAAWWSPGWLRRLLPKVRFSHD
ncbi:MMPL family transporter [Streptomyces chartreusis]|uniref:MMPL family transporter n=1 Tax=Streptomyces chartreusis TaxID=1969 RepID=UPI0034024A56